MLCRNVSLAASSESSFLRVARKIATPVPFAVRPRHAPTQPFYCRPALCRDGPTDCRQHRGKHLDSGEIQVWACKNMIDRVNRLHITCASKRHSAFAILRRLGCIAGLKLARRLRDGPEIFVYHREDFRLVDPAGRTSRDVYVSASWEKDNASALAASRLLAETGLRLIGPFVAWVE
jgi:hypothetical protein